MWSRRPDEGIAAAPPAGGDRQHQARWGHLGGSRTCLWAQEPGSGAHTPAPLPSEASGRLMGLPRPRFYRDEHLCRHKAAFGRFGSTAEQSDSQSQCLPPFSCGLRINGPTSDDKHANGRIVFAQPFSGGEGGGGDWQTPGSAEPTAPSAS